MINKMKDLEAAYMDACYAYLNAERDVEAASDSDPAAVLRVYHAASDGHSALDAALKVYHDTSDRVDAAADAVFAADAEARATAKEKA